MEAALSGNSQDTGSPWVVPGGGMLGGRDSQQARRSGVEVILPPPLGGGHSSAKISPRALALVQSSSRHASWRQSKEINE